MEQLLKEELEQAVWIGKSLFERGKTAGSTANMSFRHRDLIYISGSDSYSQLLFHSLVMYRP